MRTHSLMILRKVVEEIDGEVVEGRSDDERDGEREEEER